MPVRSRKKHAGRHLTFWVIALLIVGGAAGWWMWHFKLARSPRLNYLALSINGEIRRLLSGETLALHPDDRVKIVDISTNVPLDLNIRLSSEGLDVNALQYEELKLKDFLPHKEAFNRYRFIVHVKHYNRDIGKVFWVVQPYAEDWLDRANRIIDSDKRLVFLERAHTLMPEDRRIRRRLLEQYKLLEKWNLVARMLETKAEKKPDHETLSELLDVYRNMKSMEGLTLTLKRLIGLDPSDLEARRELAEILEKNGDLKGAIREYEALLRHTEGEDKLPVYKRLGYLYTETGKLEKAISSYLQAARIDQKDANLHYNLSYLYEKLGQEEKSNFYLDNAITLRSSDVQGRLKLAQAFLKKGRLEKARKYLSEVLDMDPESEEALAMMARILEEQGDKGSLRKVYEKILALNPANETVRYNLGALEYEEGNLKGALPYFREYVKSHPEDATARGVLFDIYKQEKDLPSAFKEAMALVELTPEDTDVYDFIFDYLKEKKEYEKLIPIMLKGVKANPGDTRLREYLVEAYLKIGKDDRVVVQMGEILKARPKGIDWLIIDVFEGLRARGAYEKILSIMKRAVKAYPKDVVFREYLVLACLRTGREEQAAQQMEEILKARPTDVDLLLQLARLREKNNHVQKAAKAYRRILEISPDHEEASEAYLRLQEEILRSKVKESDQER
ncbi:MAG: tetratricopeptide repeat protein [Deltaproteobacteria bacterium]|nr:tetratricopeptide repeat protein [Deltaproteobacteria bacterium]